MHPQENLPKAESNLSISGQYAVTRYSVSHPTWPETIEVNTYEDAFGFWTAEAMNVETVIMETFLTGDFPEEYFGPGDDPNGEGHDRFVIAVAKRMAELLGYADD